MTSEISRATFLTVCRAAQKISRAGPSRQPYLDPEMVKKATRVSTVITFEGTIGGGDETYTYARWRVPVNGKDHVVTMPIKRTRLDAILAGREEEDVA